jgi:D-glycerate 3-kinase
MKKTKPLILGINGAQGTGKSTLADFLALVTSETYDWNVASLSLDDFYLTRAARMQLAETSHPLFAIRGVPGTHDVELLAQCLRSLLQLSDGETYAPPRFDKSIDDRAPPPWPEAIGPVDLIILEGWCVGSTPQTEVELAEPVNVLEREGDPDGRWRTSVNSCLRKDYAKIFGMLDALVFLKAPSFEAVYDWRLEQEKKLAEKVGTDAPGLMNAQQIRDFIAYYERITRHNLDTLDEQADVVFELGDDHAIKSSQYHS